MKDSRAFKFFAMLAFIALLCYLAFWAWAGKLKDYKGGE